MQSKRWTWNSVDTKAFLNKALVQTAPVLLIYVGFVIEQIADGFQWSDFIPNMVVQGTIVLYILNRAYDALQRLYKGK